MTRSIAVRSSGLILTLLYGLFGAEGFGADYITSSKVRLPKDVIGLEILPTKIEHNSTDVVCGLLITTPFGAYTAYGRQIMYHRQRPSVEVEVYANNPTELVLFRKTGTFWDSRALEFSGTPQGNPYWAWEGIVPPIPKLLGYRRIDSRTFLAPSVERIHRFIDVMNEEMPDEFDIFFNFATSDTNTVPRGERLRALVEDRTFLIAPEGIARVHDYSYHIAPVFSIPTRLAKRLHAQAAIIHGFAENLRSQYTSPRFEPFRMLADQVVVATEAEIDFRAERLGQTMGNELAAFFAVKTLRSLVNDGMTPHEYFLSKIDWAKKNRLVVETEFAALDYLVAEFLKGWGSGAERVPIVMDDRGYGLELGHYHRAMLQRAREIQGLRAFTPRTH